MMTRSIKKVISLVITCSLLLLNVFIAPVYAESEGDYMKAIIENFENSFEESKYFDDLCSDRYYYEKFSNNLANTNLASRAVVWCANYLMDTRLDKDAYVDYLMQLLSMMQGNLAEVAYNKSQNVDKLNTAEGVAKDTVFAFFEIEGAASLLKDILGLSEGTADVYNTIDIDEEKSEFISFAVANYENQYLIINSIKENTDDKKLKDACDEILEVCAQQCAYISDQCIKNNIKLAKKATEFAWDQVYSVYAKEINQGFVNWLRGKMSSEASESVLRKLALAGKVANVINYVDVGFDIGSGIMKIFVGDKYEMVREELALAEISDALTDSVIETKNAAMSGSTEERYSKIQEYIPLVNALIYTHTRGEYCAIQSRNKEERDGVGKVYYENTLCPLMNEYSKVVSNILTNNDILEIEKVIYALDDVKSVHLSQNTTSDYTVMGSNVNMGISLESDVNLTNGIMHTNMTTKYGGRNVNNEIYIRTSGNTSDIYMSTSGIWVKQTGISASDLYKLGSGFEGVDGIKFYLNSMENIYLESDSDEQNHIISGVIGSKATEEALKKAGLSTIIDQLDDNDEISKSDIQSMLSNLAPMKVTFLISKDTFLPTQMTIDMKDTTESIYSNMKSIAAKYGESISYSISTNKAVTYFSKYNDLSEIFIPDAAVNGTDYKIIK